MEEGCLMKYEEGILYLVYKESSLSNFSDFLKEKKNGKDIHVSPVSIVNQNMLHNSVLCTVF